MHFPFFIYFLSGWMDGLNGYHCLLSFFMDGWFLFFLHLFVLSVPSFLHLWMDGC